jgi:uncharacterized protein (TIGR02757 family)
MVRDTPADAVAADPVLFLRRYSDPHDIEVAAVFAATLAFGRVAAFQPVIAQLLDLADQHGGPARWVDGFQPGDLASLAGIRYRWLRDSDLSLLVATIGAARRHHGSLGRMFVEAIRSQDAHVGPALDTVIGRLRDIASEQAPAFGLKADFDRLPRGFRHALPRPSGGSACKRWNMLLRWMARKPAHAGDPDLGLWAIPTRQLMIPLDTHVLRVAQLVGLTRRTDGSWRTAVEVTRNLARIDPVDPVRFDFALAHLGISGGCKARHVPDICGECPLASACRFGHERHRVTSPGRRVN